MAPQKDNEPIQPLIVTYTIWQLRGGPRWAARRVIHNDILNATRVITRTAKTSEAAAQCARIDRAKLFTRYQRRGYNAVIANVIVEDGQPEVCDAR